MSQEECVCVENAEAEKEEMIVETVEKIMEKEQKRRRDKIDIETETLANRNKLIIELTWPALAENILASLVSMADTIMVSILGSYAISAGWLGYTAPTDYAFGVYRNGNRCHRYGGTRQRCRQQKGSRHGFASIHCGFCCSIINSVYHYDDFLPATDFLDCRRQYFNGYN